MGGGGLDGTERPPSSAGGQIAMMPLTFDRAPALEPQHPAVALPRRRLLKLAGAARMLFECGQYGTV